MSILELGSIFVMFVGVFNAEVILYAVTIDVDVNWIFEFSGVFVFCGVLVSVVSVLGVEMFVFLLVGLGWVCMMLKMIVGVLVTVFGERELEGGVLAELLLVVLEMLVFDVFAELRRLTF